MMNHEATTNGVLMSDFALHTWAIRTIAHLGFKGSNGKYSHTLFSAWLYLYDSRETL